MPNLRALAALQDIDVELLHIQARLREIAAQTGNEASLAVTRDAAKAAEAEVAQLRAAQRDRELAVDGLRRTIAEREAAMYSGRITNPRELESMRQEVESQKTQAAKGEGEALSLLDDLQRAQAALAERETARQAAEARWREGQAALKAEQGALTERGRALVAQRKEVAAAVEPPLLAAYDRLRATRAGVAVARLERSACGACKVGLPTTQASRVRSGQEVVTCPMCGRILVP